MRRNTHRNYYGDGRSGYCFIKFNNDSTDVVFIAVDGSFIPNVVDNEGYCIGKSYAAVYKVENVKSNCIECSFFDSDVKAVFSCVKDAVAEAVKFVGVAFPSVDFVNAGVAVSHNFYACAGTPLSDVFGEAGDYRFFGSCNDCKACVFKCDATFSAAEGINVYVVKNDRVANLSCEESVCACLVCIETDDVAAFRTNNVGLNAVGSAESGVHFGNYVIRADNCYVEVVHILCFANTESGKVSNGLAVCCEDFEIRIVNVTCVIESDCAFRKCRYFGSGFFFEFNVREVNGRYAVNDKVVRGSISEIKSGSIKLIADCEAGNNILCSRIGFGAAVNEEHDFVCVKGPSFIVFVAACAGSVNYKCAFGFIPFSLNLEPPFEPCAANSSDNVFTFAVAEDNGIAVVAPTVSVDRANGNSVGYYFGIGFGFFFNRNVCVNFNFVNETKDTIGFNVKLNKVCNQVNFCSCCKSSVQYTGRYI